MSCSCFGSLSVGGKREYHHNLQEINGSLRGNIKHFTYRELNFATNNFHPSNKIGRGGFGVVFKGILKNGMQVAVKSLSVESKQGMHEFLTEIDVVANVRHPNLVELIGYCVHGNDRILIYEYMENNSLDRALLGHRQKNIKLDWLKRCAICLGTAKGLAFLHEEIQPPIVHRDIKASNVLLDENLDPKIGDFGLAKFFPENITHISTRVAGTTGYLAPEYALQGQLTKKADVYSFGVLLLEIVSGRSSSKENWGGMQHSIVQWTWQLYKEERLLELVDTDLEQYPEAEVFRYMKIALFCTQAQANRRPSMTQVVDMLSRNIRLNEKELTAPGFFEARFGSHGSSSNKNPTSDITSELMSSYPSTITQVIPR
ncbi:hypothetical protein GIB67_021268 [Kingdonia uniflora]|uniref:Protein kinase domain-containing protein n=1 Tax=Kingdonia uniflora TaxID=39325 RepID=A0A7J7LFU4_9MAGN|nr:hypothetical protein GIB67_021268 [Kingdonia uniflora]